MDSEMYLFEKLFSWKPLFKCEVLLKLERESLQFVLFTSRSNVKTG